MSPLRPGPATAGSAIPAVPPGRGSASGGADSWSGPLGRGRLPDPATPTAPGAPAQLPTLTLPEGGAAVRGMGETLEPVSLRGTSGLRVPIAGTSARGRDPGLGLTYSSGQGNSAFGLGWDLPLPGIVRKTERGLPRYTDDDRFVLLGTDDLVRVADEEAPAPFAGTGEPTRRTRYRPRTEGSFVRVERHRPLSGTGEFWATYSTGNVLTVYGRSELSRIADPEHPERVFSWLPEDVFDDRGDHLHYRWVADDARGVDYSHPAEQHRIGTAPAQRYLREVAYLNATPVPDRGQALPVDHSDPMWRQRFQAVVVLDYGDFPGFGPAAAPAQRPGVEPTGSWTWRADRFSSHRAGFELRTQRRCRRFLTLHRFPGQLGPDWQLVAATELGYDDDPVAARLTSVTTVGYAADGSSLRPPALTLGYQPWAPGTAAQRLDPGRYAPMGVQSPYQLVDLDGDGAAGILLADGPSWLYQANLGDGRFAPPTPVATAPASPPERAPAVASLFADGRLAVTDHDGGTVRYAVRDPQTLAWAGWRPFPHSPVLDWSDPRVRQVDLDGDGVSDILVHEAESLAWHRFAGVDGWKPRRSAPAGADEAAGPRVAFTAPDAAVLLADMTGDGLDDIVRVTADSVCYWPNQGYGRFGARVTMGGAPVLARPADFRPARVRLADVDGTGPADLVYLGSEGVRYWPNQAGNGWGPVTALTGVVVPEPTGAVHLVDLLGRGTLCLVLSDSDPATPADALRYVDLMPDGKPGLLTSLNNGRGLRTTISYASSTQYALRDRREGAPWSTHLPVPVHVVAAVTRIDDTTGVRNTSSYRYRDGYYDIAEREFRGFGCVSQADTDTLRSFLQGPAGSWLEQPETLPPQVTVCWYHTGSDRQALPGRGIGDVWEPAAAARPAEALRALRGSLLREASYALDGSALARYPYAVTEHSYRLRLLDPGAGDPDGYAVTVVLPAETTHTAYERAPVPDELWYPDPAYLATLPAPPVGPGEPARTSHSFSLVVNDWGQVERGLEAAYGRTDPAARPAQRDPVVTSTEADFGNLTSAAGDYRIGVPLARRDYQVRGAGVPVAGRYDSAAAAALAGAPVIPDGTAAPAGASRSRLAETRYRYWDDTASTELPAGSFGRRALGRRVLAATVTEHAVGLLPANSFTADGHYLELSDVDGPATRWASSPVACPDPARFYQPAAVVDSFGLGTFVDYDTTGVLATSVLTCPAVPDPGAAQRFVPDPAVTGWNRTSAQYDYRLLQPVHVTDPHGSTAEAEYDALGALVRSRRHGRAGEGSPPGEWDSEFSYRLDAWTASRTPLWMSSRVREEYAPGSPWRTSIRYLDGAGRPLLSKVEAEPGPAPYYGPDGKLVLDPVTGAPALRETAPVRWLGNGRLVYDGKGRPVCRYDPYFAPDERYEDEAVLATTGQPVYLRYDPAGRISRVDYPDGSYDRIELTPWSTTSWDRCDTVLDSAGYQRMTDAGATPDEQRAAAASAAHAGTPGTQRLDPAGRVVELVERDGVRELVTTVGHDGAGRPVAVTDPRGVTIATTVYDLAGRPVIATSADGGEQQAQWDAAGRTVRTWIGGSGADFAVRTRIVRDRYGRDRETWVLDRAAGEDTEVCRVVQGFGDDDIASAIPSYLLGQAHQVFDGAGAALTLRCDFRGRVVESARRFATRPDTEPAWDGVAAAAPAADRTPVAGAALEPTGLPIAVAYDALGRPVRTTNADGSVVEVAYGAGGLPASVRLTLPGEVPRTVVDRVVYDVLRRRELVAYGPAGSVAQVRAEFDAVTQRLSRIAAGPSGAPPGSLQDLRFGYDATGNLLWVRDQAQQTRFFNNTVVSAERGYTYDDRYQLVAATGREAAGTAHTTAGADRQPTVRDLPDPGDLTAVVRYQETYRYDDAGNLTELRHVQQVPGGATWVRTSTPETTSNRLATTTVSGDGTGSDPLAHDARGNLTTLGYLDFSYDWGSRPRRVVVSGNVTAYYQYAADGTRVRSAVYAGAQVRERRYLGGCEYDTVTVNGTLTEEVRTVRVSTGDRVALLVERSTVEGRRPVTRAAVSRYQLGDLLDSTVLELDEAGNPLTYEEFHPYGTTAYESRRPAAGVSRKRYRFTAKERDEETGLSYHGARYYAPWLGRWLTPDPAGLADGANRYSYCQGRPTSLHDPDGRQSAPPPPQPIEDAGAPPPITDAGADPAVKKDAPPGGGVKQGGTGGIEKYEYVANPNRIEAQDQAVQGAKAGFVNTAVDTATQQLKAAVRAPVKQATGGVIPDVVLDELPLLKGVQHRIDLLGESLKLDVPQSEAGGAGYVGGMFLFFFAQNLAVGLAGRVGGGITAPAEVPPAEPPPTARFNVGTSGGKPVVVFGEEAPTFGYNANAAPRPIDPTTFGTGPGSKALAGTPGGPLVLSGVDDTAVGVYQYRLGTGQQQLPFFRDIGKVEGTYYATHAEAKAYLLNPNATNITVSKPPCIGCIQGFRFETQLTGKTIQINAPTTTGAGTWTFNPQTGVWVTPWGIPGAH